MTTNYHTPIQLNAAGNSAVVNSPLGQLDAAITNILTGVTPFNIFRFSNDNTYPISSGEININGDLFVYVESESGTSDDLDTINTNFSNHIVFIKPVNGHTITLTSAGNINNTPVELEETQVALLLFVDNEWYIIGITNSGGGGTPYTPSIAILRDEKASGTNGGSAAATTWNARDLNTEVSDTKNIVSIASNQFIPIAGTYKIQVSAAVHQGVGVNRLRLYNVTAASAVSYGLNSRAPSVNQSIPATLSTIFTANGTDAYRIEHYTNSAQATNGLGFPLSLPNINEVYLEVILEKID